MREFIKFLYCNCNSCMCVECFDCLFGIGFECNSCFNNIVYFRVLLVVKEFFVLFVGCFGFFCWFFVLIFVYYGRDFFNFRMNGFVLLYGIFLFLYKLGFLWNFFFDFFCY